MIFLTGEYLHDDAYAEDEEKRRFPNREARLTRLPHAGDILHYECVGDYFAPSGSLPRFTPEDFAADRVPSNGQFVPGPFSRYREHATRD